ncbi:hypothetical protein UlMin_010851 [Ulmus minor]
MEVFCIPRVGKGYKAYITSKEKNRASFVVMNANIHRTKARLLEEFPKLQRLALKKVKGLSSLEFATRNELVLTLLESIQAIPNGTRATPKQSGDMRFDDEYFQTTEEVGQFRQEYENDEKGLDTLKNMAHDMNQVIDNASSNLKNKNERLRDTIT